MFLRESTFVDAYDFRFKIISSPFSNMRNAFVEATYPLGMEFTLKKSHTKYRFKNVMCFKVTLIRNQK